MEEINELRSFIRNILLKIKKEQKESLKLEAKQERELRKILRKTIFETKNISSNTWILWPKKSIFKKLNEVKETAPHESTGINLLAKLLDNIIPVVETGYKNLTTDVHQRKSFRAHVMKATQNLLSTASVYFNDDDQNTKEPVQTAKPNQELEEQDVDPKKKMFIDIKKDEKDAEVQAQKDPENAFQPIKGEDTTGRAFALETFKKIQKQTLESYSLLSNPKDRKTFYKYLITNLGLYFDQFEDELKTIVPEPTTPEYEAEKSKKTAELQGSSTEVSSTGMPPSDNTAVETPPEI
jgi:hypothetical protein